MINFFKKKDTKNENKIDLISKTASLLIHAAKIDENYTEKEKSIIKKTLISLGVKEENLSELIETAEKNEKDSNQILDFTKEIKGSDDKFKTQIVECLWKIIYSDKNSDIYESNLMRRLSGLLYLDNKLAGDIKEKIKKNINK